MPNKSDKNKINHHGHKGHMWMMAICCGLPIIGFLAIAVLGISLPSLETVFLLLCPIGMIGMMYFMHRDGCTSSRQDEDGKPALTHQEADDVPSTPSTESEKDTASTKTGWLEA
ncbi:MAG: hypothetical protein GWP56_17000 [Gammaproteobacteria bacterium]|jgi:hypothetical protein|nr:hypothetical protein [Gammaproteobacteria bacterium]